MEKFLGSWCVWFGWRIGPVVLCFSAVAVIRPFLHYDPFLLRCYAVGLLLGLIGFVLSLPGKGKLRWPACLISFAMVFMWLVAASME